MNEENVKVEVEVESDTEEQAEKPEFSATAHAVLGETARFVETLGNAIATTAQDITGLMVVQLEKEKRERLDLLVDAGLAKSRRKAAKAMLQEGLEGHEELFDKVERTRAQIAALKEQLRSLVPQTN